MSLMNPFLRQLLVNKLAECRAKLAQCDVALDEIKRREVYIKKNTRAYAELVLEVMTLLNKQDRLIKALFRLRLRVEQENVKEIILSTIRR